MITVISRPVSPLYSLNSPFSSRPLLSTILRDRPASLSIYLSIYLSHGVARPAISFESKVRYLSRWQRQKRIPVIPSDVLGARSRYLKPLDGRFDERGYQPRNDIGRSDSAVTVSSSIAPSAYISQSLSYLIRVRCSII